MARASERLQRCLVLADQGASQRAALAEELTDFLVHWPTECPEKMRRPVAALLDMTLTEATEYELHRLAKLLEPVPELPVTSYARLFAVSSPAAQRRILGACVSGPVHRPRGVTDPDGLISAARVGHGDFSPELARRMAISSVQSADILRDESGMSLAVLCKGVLLGKARFSALSLILFQDLSFDAARLDVFDDIPTTAAMRLVSIWQVSSADRQTGGASRL